MVLTAPADPLRILALVADGFGATGGIARYNRDLVTALSASATVGQVVVVPRFGDTRGLALPAGVEQVDARGGRLAWAMAAAQQALARGFDAIFCGHIFATPVAAVLARLTAKPLWLQVHGIEAWTAPGQAAARATADARLITCVSRYTRARLLGWCDIDPARVRVLPNTVDARFAPGPKPPQLLQRLGLDGRRVILTVSRLSSGERYKGHDRIIAALPAVIARHPDAVYVVAGEGDDRGRLEQLARDADVTAHLRFVGQLPADELADAYRMADVFCMPSTGEGFGIVFLEAAASGLSVIGGNRDGSVDALAEGRIGRLVDPHDAGQLIAARCDALDGHMKPAPPGEIERFGFANFSSHVDDLVRHHL